MPRSAAPTMFLLLPFAGGCSSDDQSQVEARLQAQDARIDELARRVERLSASRAPETHHITVDAAGRVTATLGEADAVACAKFNLELLVTAQTAWDAAFDGYGDSFEQIGFSPTNQGDCAANVAFSMGGVAMQLVPDDREPKVPLGVALVVRGEGAGRVFAVDETARVFEAPRVATERLPAILQAQEWVGGR